MIQDVKNSLKRYFSVGPKTTFVVLLLIAGMSLTLYSMRKTITISIDDEELKVVTYRRDVQSVLARNNITIGPKDKINTSIDSKVKNGDKIDIIKAVNVVVLVDGQELEIATAEADIEDMLQAEGIVLSDYDRVSPLMTEPIEEGLEIRITRVESQVLKETRSVDFATVHRKDNNLAKTDIRVIQEGEYGEREVATRVVYEDGQEVSRQTISDVVKKQPVQKIILQGTLGVLNLSRGGTTERVLYKSSMRVKAYAYTAGVESTGKSPGMPGYGITASGMRVRRDPNGYSTIAVDPRVIPLGTKLYVEGYGLAIAADTGSGIKGNTIDLYMHTVPETRNWGVRHVNIYILK
jgi:uncharacterized protein YabE (DUF348 family)